MWRRDVEEDDRRGRDRLVVTLSLVTKNRVSSSTNYMHFSYTWPLNQCYPSRRTTVCVFIIIAIFTRKLDRVTQVLATLAQGNRQAICASFGHAGRRY